MTSIQLGLKAARKSGTANSKPTPGKRKPVFGNDDSDDEDQPSSALRNGEEEITAFDGNLKPSVTVSASSRAKLMATSKNPVSRNKALPSDQKQSLSSLRSTAQATEAVDPSIYDYDTFHTASAVAQRARKEETAKSTQDGQDYMTDLMAAAEQRKKDQLRAKDRLLQREREQEGDDYKDKDMFVTEAYKEQQAEMRKAEEEEKKREIEQERKKKAVGMSGFHRTMMNEEDKRHQDTLEAERKLKESGSSAGLLSEDLDKEKSEADLAREAAAKGQNVELNEEGQVADKRELLSGGLNIVMKPKATSSNGPNPNSAAQKAANNAFRPDMDARQAQRERQTRMMEAQLEQSAKRKAEEEAEEVLKRERAAKSQKTTGEISSAKERYLQRKREAAAEKARGEG